VQILTKLKGHVSVGRDRETIDRELRLLAAIRQAGRERGGVLPSVRPVDDIETLWRATSWPDRTGDMAHVGWPAVTRCWRERCS